MNRHALQDRRRIRDAALAELLDQVGVVWPVATAVLGVAGLMSVKGLE
jgi:hypothetical protein